MRIQVIKVDLPKGGTVGLGYGKDADGCNVVFCGEHRAMRELAIALSETTRPVYAIVEEWQVYGAFS